MVLKVPSRIDLEGSLKFSESLHAIQSADEIAVSFEDVTWVQPFGMLYMGHIIRTFIVDHPTIQVDTVNVDAQKEAISYAANVGFFKSWPNTHQDLRALAKGGPTYLPITQMSLATIDNSPHYGRKVQDIADGLAERLVSSDTGVMFEAVTYAMREIIRNVVEHSKSTELWYCAQLFRARNEVEIAIVDTGVGLREALYNNPHIRANLITDRDALMYGLTPGVSGKMFKGVKQDLNNDWQKSGFGLYMTYRLCNEGGSFFICSGDAGLYREKGKTENIHRITAF